MISLIVAIAKNGVIGNTMKTPWNIPEEMALFKAATMGSPVIVGRKTFESIGKPLPGRKTIVLSRTLDPIHTQNLVIISSINEALQEIEGHEKAFVIGGQEIYAQMMPYVDEMLVSHVKAPYDGDTFFPDINMKTWKEVETSEHNEFTHKRYLRI